MVAGKVGADIWGQFPRKSFPALIADRARSDGDKPFLVEAATGHTLTYASFQEEGLRWARALRGLGAAPGHRVAMMLGTSECYFCAALGVGWLRGIEVALNTELRGSLLAHSMRVTSPDFLVVDHVYLDLLLEIEADIPRGCIVIVKREPGGGPVPQIGGLKVIELSEFLASPTAQAVDFVAPELHDIASVCFTSGTTGPAKGVLQPWLQIYRNAVMAWQTYRQTPEDVLHMSSAPYHSSVKVFPYYMALAGGTLVYREKFSPSRLLDEVRRFHCTAVLLVGAMGRFLMKQEAKPDDHATDLRLALMNPALPEVDEFKRRFGVDVITCYGMTEISVPFCSMGYELTAANAASCGRLVDGIEARLTDENDIEVAPGERGELLLRSDEPWALNAGYLNMPEATAQAWRNGWFHTGDMFHCDNQGFYYFEDRIKNAIRRRGENISSFEIEKFVVMHPEVSEVAAVAAPSDNLEDEVKICVVRTAGSSLTPASLIEFLIPKMPRHMVPRYVEFMSELPVTPTARIKKKELRDSALNTATWDREMAAYVVRETVMETN